MDQPFSTHCSNTHVHILLCSHNGADLIEEQLDSFLAQTYQDWSLWVSDDGSTDATLEKLDQFARKHPGRVACIVEGPGLGIAANFLHLLSHSDLPLGLVALSDQDDVWLPHKLERAVTQLSQAGDAPCVWAARYWYTDAQLKPLRCSVSWRRGPSLENALVQNILSGHTITLNPAALALVRQAGLPPVAHHDWWIYLLSMACGAQAIIDQEPALFYRQHSANAVGQQSTLTARLRRLSALKSGLMGEWIKSNLTALIASDLPLTPQARDIARIWMETNPNDRYRVLQSMGIHRQSWAETALIHLAARVGKL